MDFNSLENKIRRIKELKLKKTGKCSGCEHYGGRIPVYDDDREIIGYELTCPTGFELCRNGAYELSDELKAYIFPEFYKKE